MPSGEPFGFVLSVEKNSPAYYAGIRGLTPRNMFSLPVLGDIIIKVNGIPVNSEGDFLQAVDLKTSGDIVELTIRRCLIGKNK
jgi:S1-C subfamily serine protease